MLLELNLGDEAVGKSGAVHLCQKLMHSLTGSGLPDAADVCTDLAGVEVGSPTL